MSNTNDSASKKVNLTPTFMTPNNMIPSTTDFDKLLINVHLDEVAFNRKPTNEEAGSINNRIAENTCQISLAGLIEAILKGHAWTPAVFTNKTRGVNNWEGQQSIAADIDKGITWEELLARLKQLGFLPTFAYTTFSSTPELEKFRIVWVLEKPIVDKKLMEFLLNDFLGTLIPEYDTGAKSIANIYYGGKELLYYEPNNVIRSEDVGTFIESAQAYVDANKPKSENKKALKTNKKKKSKKYSETEILELLEYVNANDYDYNGWLAIGMAIHSENEDYYHLWDSWSQTNKEKYDPTEMQNRWDSFSEKEEGEGITIATLIAEAQKNGWESKKKSRSKSKPKADYLKEAFENLYLDVPTFCMNGTFYRWVGTHYEEQSEVDERRRVANYCDNYAEEGENSLYYPLLDPYWTEKIYKWATQLKSINSKQLANNQSVINCTNGMLVIEWDKNNKPTWSLKPHTPEIYCITAPVCEYNPLADSFHIEELLKCLEPEQQQIFLRIVAASLDLPKIRSLRGRTVRAALCIGQGSNGKDTLRNLVELLFGNRVSSVSLEAFKAADENKLFGLVPLVTSQINWASENSPYRVIDSCQTFKACITGDPQNTERKFKDVDKFTPKFVSFNNFNELPTIRSGDEAITSRFAILNFNKTYKLNADPTRGELQANFKYKDDNEFLKEFVLPAFINKLLEALKSLVEEGIDYSSTENAMHDLRVEKNHLMGCLSDLGVIAGEGEMYISDLFQEITKWYVKNDYAYKDNNDRLVYVKDALGEYDKPVTHSNQLFARLRALFPNLKKIEQRTSRGYKIYGLCKAQLSQPATPTPIENNAEKSEETKNAKLEATAENQAIPKKNSRVAISDQKLDMFKQEGTVTDVATNNHQIIVSVVLDRFPDKRYAFNLSQVFQLDSQKIEGLESKPETQNKPARRLLT